MEYNQAPRIDAFTQGCRDLLRMFTYEAIVACTVYAAPMLFMLGPAAILAQHPFILIVLHSVLGFSMSWAIHRMGHRLLTALPKTPQNIFVFGSFRLPMKLRLCQILWMMEILVGSGVFLGILAKRVAGSDLVTSLMLAGLGIVLYFMPVYLTKLWTRRYYPAMTLLRPTEDVINKSVPALRSFFQ